MSIRLAASSLVHWKLFKNTQCPTTSRQSTLRSEHSKPSIYPSTPLKPKLRVIPCILLPEIVSLHCIDKPESLTQQSRN